ncbi:IS66 family insertion sequence element accessory protein TnpA [Chitinophaga filiformis]|uniref:Transposase n=1 Tax=Chitinophaga filiformis TaxID=104663 RepID=A0A1G7HKX8_CHIFI|nr:hypothetical protein [Chitinophaga filiformis]SDF01011.1 hypothetical protein SAMN04488121_101510 [Chitinophaga filiformis]
MSISPTTPVKHRRSINEKKKLLMDWQQSNLTMKAFCLEKQIPLSGLRTWIKQFDMGRKRPPRRKVTNQFISIIPDQAVSMSVPFVEYLLPDNSRLVIHHPVTAAFLNELLHIDKK